MNKTLHLPQTKHNSNTVTWRFRKRNHLAEGFSGFVKLFSDSTNRMHETQESETGFD